MKKQIRQTIEDLGWRIIKCGDGTVELEKSSPAGENISFTVSAENAEQEIYANYEGFDVDEHTETEVRNERTHGVRI